MWVFTLPRLFRRRENILEKIQLALDLLVQMRYNNLGFLKMLEWLSR